MQRRRKYRTRVLLGREDLCRVRIRQLTALAEYLGYEVTLSSQRDPRWAGLIRPGREIGVWAEALEDQLSTLAHEICHAGLWELRISTSFIENNPGASVEEGLCYAFENLMMGALLNDWPHYFRGSDVSSARYFLSRFVEQLRLSLLHRCVNVTKRKSNHEEALNLTNAIKDGLAAFGERWRDGRYEEMRDAVTDVFENLFDLVDLCNSLIAGRRSQQIREAEAQEGLFQL